jgi:hypothetical protein
MDEYRLTEWYFLPQKIRKAINYQVYCKNCKAEMCSCALWVHGEV